MSGFQSPNYTQVPNDLFDEKMRDMSNPCLRVILAIVRQTVGYHRTTVKYSVGKLKEITGMSRSSVVKGAKEAEEKGFIERLNYDNQSSAQWGLALDTPPQNEHPPSAEKTPPIQSAEDSIGVKESIKESIKESTTTAPPEKNIFTLYEENIGMLTPMMSDTLKDAEDTYPDSWFKDAFALAVTANVRRWNYVDAILKRWQVDGKDDGKQKKKSYQKNIPKEDTLSFLKSRIAASEAA